MPKKKWNAEISYQVGNFPKVLFFGRQRFRVEDKHKAELLRLGVFKEEANGSLFYSAPIKFMLEDGTLCFVDENGIVDIDISKAHPRYIDKDGNSMLPLELVDP